MLYPPVTRALPRAEQWLRHDKPPGGQQRKTVGSSEFRACDASVAAAKAEWLALFKETGEGPRKAMRPAATVPAATAA